MESFLKIVISGLDNAGKTSILTALDKKYDFQKDIVQLKPTIRVEYHKMNFLKNNSIFWDMGGQTSYREVYMQYQDVYFDATDLLIYVIDIQDPERFENSLEYLDAILTFFTESKMDVPVIIAFHKFDPDLRGNEEILQNINELRTKLLDKYPNFKILFQQTSIFDIISIVQLVSYGLSVFDEKFFELSELLEGYIEEFENQALLVFDRNGIIISEYYSDIDSEVYVELLDSIKEHLFLLKRLEEETTYEYDHDLDNVDHVLFSYLHRLKIGSELFFISAVTKKERKEKLLTLFPEFLEDLTQILKELI
ncbi:MAG: 50S ribosome-binding GTPase [Candidatus Lokiarchaeota archaeon]|nr:50S ribosome-binding GTPase [Candidatus Lokiarchaeota archaeon]